MVKYWEKMVKYWGEMVKYWGEMVKYLGNMVKYWGEMMKYWGEIGKYVGKMVKYVGNMVKYWGEMMKYWGEIGKYVGKMVKYVGKMVNDGEMILDLEGALMEFGWIWRGEFSWWELGRSIPLHRTSSPVLRWHLEAAHIKGGKQVLEPTCSRSQRTVCKWCMKVALGCSPSLENSLFLYLQCKFALGCWNDDDINALVAPMDVSPNRATANLPSFSNR